MELFRVWSWNRSSLPDREGGALFIPRARQGSGRHDNPELYGAFYCSLEPFSCIAEALQPFRTQSLTDTDFQRSGNRVLALAAFELADDAGLVDLDNPAELQPRGLRPSRLATHERARTQQIAAALYQEGIAGFLWWSTLESLWINCTLFYERARGSLRMVGGPWPLTVRDERVRAAAQRLGIQISR